MLSIPAKASTAVAGPAPAGRVHSVDILRGFCASAIMFYHFSYWMAADLAEPLRSAMLKLGIYGVELFFVISGFSLTIAYSRVCFERSADWRHFYARRACRILPLLLLITAAQAGLMAQSARHGGAARDWSRAAGNVLLLPIIARPDLALATGAWSLGVELGFYLAFPALMLLLRRSTAAGVVAMLFATAVTLIWPYLFLDTGRTLPQQWPDYVATANHMAFFAAGVAIARFRPNPSLPGAVVIIASAAAALTTWPVPDQIVVVSGPARPIAFALCSLLVMAVASLSTGTGRAAKPFIFLGDVSYGVYLIHPIVLSVLASRHLPLPAYAQFTLAVAATLAAAWISFRWFEKPLMKLGRRLERTGEPVVKAADVAP